MIDNHGVAALQGVAGWSGGYWSRTVNDGDLIQHSFWLFDTEEHADSAATNFNILPRDARRTRDVSERGCERSRRTGVKASRPPPSAEAPNPRGWSNR